MVGVVVIIKAVVGSKVVDILFQMSSDNRQYNKGLHHLQAVAITMLQH